MKQLMWLTALLLSGSLHSTTVAGQASRDTLVLATYQYSTNTRTANLQPLANTLQQQLGSPVKVKSYPSVQQLITGLSQQEVDIAFISTMGYLLYDQQSQKHYIPTVSLQFPPDTASDHYKSCIVARQDFAGNDIRSLQTVKGKNTFAFVNKGSTSGNLIPRLALSGAGISSPEAVFSDIIYTGNHKSALEGVINGQYQFAAFGKEEYATLRKDNPGAVAAVKVLWSSAEIPLGPVLLRAGMQQKNKTQIVRTLLQLHQQQPAAFDAIKAGWTEAKYATAFKPVTRAAYYQFLNVQSNPKVVKEILEQFDIR
nr:phosphate/phosphite/phosphonate ABC transporter substrate-binding protein [uncultured Chitinophaga sp.]